MDITLTHESIVKFKEWLNYYKKNLLDATNEGILAGLKWSLTKLTLTDNIRTGLETTVSVSQSVVDELKDKYRKNKIDALWNLGVASSVYWVLEELGISMILE